MKKQMLFLSVILLCLVTIHAGDHFPVTDGSKQRYRKAHPDAGPGTCKFLKTATDEDGDSSGEGEEPTRTKTRARGISASVTPPALKNLNSDDDDSENDDGEYSPGNKCRDCLEIVNTMVFAALSSVGRIVEQGIIPARRPNTNFRKEE